MTKSAQATLAIAVATAAGVVPVAGAWLDGKSSTSVRAGQRNGELVIYRGEGADRKLYAVRPDGTGLRHLADGVHGALSPDGTKLAVARPSRGVMKIFIGARTRAGWTFRPLLPNSRRQDFWPSWSPDGTRLAFARSREPVPRNTRIVNFGSDPLDIWTANADGTSARKLAGGSRPHMHSAGPSWSPDGRWIAFSALPIELATQFRGVHVGGNVYVMRADGSDLRQLTRTDAPEDNGVWQQPWSPDGRELVFTRRRHGIWTMTPAGANQRRLDTGGKFDVYPIWSPDGTKIAFTRSTADDTPYVYVMGADGASPRRVTQGVAYQWRAG